MTHEELRLDLGAYTLGTLDPAEADVVRAHLATCDACRAEAGELSGLPALLQTLSLEEASGAVLATPQLYESLRSRALADERAARTRRNRRLTAVAAAVVLLLALGITGAVVVEHRQVWYSASQGDVHLRVRLNAKDTGTALVVKVRGLPAKEECRLVAVGADGRREDAGWWIADYEGEAKVTGATSIPRADLAQVLVLDEQGNTLVATSV